VTQLLTVIDIEKDHERLRVREAVGDGVCEAELDESIVVVPD